MDFKRDKYEDLFIPEFEELDTLEFIKNKENIILLGTSGAGKTHYAIAVGIAACMKGHSVLFATVPNMIIELKETLGTNQMTNYRKRFEKYDLVILDELGYVSMERNQTKAFDYLTLEGIKAILSEPDQSTKNGFRDLVLLTLMYDSGARVQEIADLTASMLRLDEPATIRLTGKGNKTRIVPLMSRTANLLRKYMEHFRVDSTSLSSQPLFYSRKCEKLTRSGISFILNKYTEMARIKKQDVIPAKVTPHTMRHSKAMHLLQSGVNLVYIRDVLGHSNIQTTEVYARADTQMKRSALEKAYYPDLQNETPSWQNNPDLLSWLQTLGN